MWTRASHKINMNTSSWVKPPGLINEDTPGRNARRVVTDSDGLVYSKENIGSAAWMIQEDDQQHMIACFLTNLISSTTSHRAELEGAFRLLKHIKLYGMKSTEVEQWYDNLRAVHSTNEEIWSPKGMGKSEADRILAIHHLKKDLPNLKEYKHVYARQDTRNTEKPTDVKQKKKERQSNAK